MFLLTLGFQGSVDSCLQGIARDGKIDLKAGKAALAVARMRGYTAKKKALQQRNLELRILMEQRKG